MRKFGQIFGMEIKTYSNIKCVIYVMFINNNKTYCEFLKN